MILAVDGAKTAQDMHRRKRDRRQLRPSRRNSSGNQKQESTPLPPLLGDPERYGGGTGCLSGSPPVDGGERQIVRPTSSGLDLSFAPVDPRNDLDVSGRVEWGPGSAATRVGLGGWTLCESGQPCLLALCFGRELGQGCTVQGPLPKWPRGARRGPAVCDWIPVGRGGGGLGRPASPDRGLRGGGMETRFVSVTPMPPLPPMPRTSETDTCRHVSLRPGQRLGRGDLASVAWCGWKPSGAQPLSNVYWLEKRVCSGDEQIARAERSIVTCPRGVLFRNSRLWRGLNMVGLWAPHPHGPGQVDVLDVFNARSAIVEEAGATEYCVRRTELCRLDMA